MSRATMSDLMQAVKAALPKISAAQARNLIKANNTTSTAKIEEVAAGYKGKSKEELAAEFGEAGDEEFPQAQGNKRGAAKKAGGKKNGAAKKVARSGARERRSATVVTAGPRGFRYGERWIQSVIDGTAPATANANINKLYAHADELGVQYDKRSDDAAAICKRMASKARKQLEAGA